MSRFPVTLLCLTLATPAAAEDVRPRDGATAGADLERDPTEIIQEARAEIDRWTRAFLDEGANGPGPADKSELSVGVLPPSMSSSSATEARLPGHTPATQPPADLEWLQGLTLPDLPVRWDPRLIDLLVHYRDDPRAHENVRALLERAGRYETMVKRTMRERGLPEDLFYVAMVESGFDPTAQSPARAVGMWQFVAATASDYDLERSRFLDERRDVEASTRAAAAFFADLHERLGSWPLALAGFNMGYGALVRSIRKYNSNDFWLLSQLEAGLPYETVAYVIKVMAYAIIAHNPERFGFADLAKESPREMVLVQVPGGTGLGRLARAAGMPTDELAALNPELRKHRVPPDVREFALRIPADSVERFRRRWPEIAPRTGSHAVHVLRFGERLRDVAELYDTSERRLRMLNELGDDEVKPGTRLLVPDVEPRPGEPEPPPIVGVPETRFDYPSTRHVFYRVLDGDTPSQIATFFGVHVDDLRRWNDISTDAALISGMYLQIFVPQEVDLSRALIRRPDEVEMLAVGSEKFFDYYEAQRERVRIRYRVKKGDSLRSLASRYDLSVGSIARINRFSRYSELEPNSEIILYVPQK